MTVERIMCNGNCNIHPDNLAQNIFYFDEDQEEKTQNCFDCGLPMFTQSVIIPDEVREAFYKIESSISEGEEDDTEKEEDSDGSSDVEELLEEASSCSSRE